MNPRLSRFFWEGFQPSQFDLDQHSLSIHLTPDPDYVPTCSSCSEPQYAVHDCSFRQIRETDCLIAYYDTPLGQQILNEWSGIPAMTKVKPMV